MSSISGPLWRSRTTAARSRVVPAPSTRCGRLDRHDREQAHAVGRDDGVEHEPAHVAGIARARSAARRTCRRRRRRSQFFAPPSARRSASRSATVSAVVKKRALRRRSQSHSRVPRAAGGGVRSEAPIAFCSAGQSSAPGAGAALVDRRQPQPRGDGPEPLARPLQERQPGLAGAATEDDEHRRLTRARDRDPQRQRPALATRAIERDAQRRARRTRHVGAGTRAAQPRPGSARGRGARGGGLRSIRAGGRR